MKTISEEQPEDGDVVEVCYPDGSWRKATYYWGVIGLGTFEEVDNESNDEDLYLDEYPETEWRAIEGYDMSAIGNLPPQKSGQIRFTVETANEDNLREFMSQFPVTITSSGGLYIIDCQQELGPYLFQQIRMQDLGTVKETTNVEA